jgi:hypothetical protein
MKYSPLVDYDNNANKRKKKISFQKHKEVQLLCCQLLSSTMVEPDLAVPSVADPIAFLNSMREKTAHLLEALDTDHQITTDLSAIEKPVQVDSRAPSDSKAVSDTAVAPPGNLSPEEEVEWCKRRLAQLSGPVDDNGVKGESKSDSKSESKGSCSIGFKSSSKGEK